MSDLIIKTEDLSFSDSAIKNIFLLAEQQRQIEIELGALALKCEALLKAKKKELTDLSEDAIPTAFNELGTLHRAKVERDNLSYDLKKNSLGAWVLKIKTNGKHFKVELKDSWFASVSKEKKPFVMNWLRDNKLSEIISNEIKIKFLKGEDNQAKELLSSLIIKGYIAEQIEDINTATLKSTCKELSQDSDYEGEIPLKELGIFIKSGSQVKLLKK